MPYTNSRGLLSALKYKGVAAATAAGLAFGAASSAAWYGTRLVADESRPPEAAAARTIGAGVDSYSELVDQVAPAVVTIRAEGRRRPAQQFQVPDDRTFRRFFGERQAADAAAARALGSGVIVTHRRLHPDQQPRGRRRGRHPVEITDGAASTRSWSAPTSRAIWRCSRSTSNDLHTLALGNSERVKVGDVVLAVGNPLGVGQTVTMGIISAKGRSTGVGDGSYEDFLQTDAPINHGNSGGALVNTKGELVGINSQILSESGGNIGIGFAIPANMAKNVMEQLRQRQGPPRAARRHGAGDHSELRKPRAEGVHRRAGQRGRVGQRRGARRREAGRRDSLVQRSPSTTPTRCATGSRRRSRAPRSRSISFGTDTNRR